MKFPPWTSVSEAARLLKAGEVVAIPTETVYGLAGNAFEPKALAKIFAAKERPTFDPLIVHIADIAQLTDIAKDIPDSAYRLAETGHLTFATLHTNSCVQTINRVVDAFPKGEQQTVRTQLSFVLQGVICQTLLPKIGGGRVMAYEVMNVTPGIRALIRDDKVHQIESMIEIGQKFGMNTMNMCLCELVKNHKIDRFDALARSSSPDQLEQLFVKEGV